jgi:Uma2 family endonuclease
MNPEIIREIVYPETDGEPMGETDLHIHWMIELRDILKRRYRGQQVYVASNLLVYYEQDFPHYYVVPDVFVVKNSAPDFRRVYKVWEEGQSPHFVLEVTSASTRREDQEKKPNKYAEIGVNEYFLFDPSGEYLRPALVGHRLAGEDYTWIAADEQGRLFSEQLNVWLRVEDSSLMLYDGDSGARLLSSAEAEIAAEAAAEAAEEENRRLREELRRLGQSD